ncbi:tetratricopeptide repeat protein [Fodinibius sp. AD559]|uniref:tetratricopeptide repeat protein n=1 Tax=Fodinibius sp. AD559 TaxID=3424179 RepID=UPI004046A3D5
MNTILSHNRVASVYIFIVLLCIIAASSVSAQNQTIEEQEYIAAQTAYIGGLAAFENNNYEEAISLLNKAYVKLPDHPGINFALADAYLQINDFENAEYYSKQAQTLNPENKWYHLQLVEIYKAIGNNEAAAKELRNALTYHPKDIDILYDLAQIYTKLGKLKQSNTIYNKLLQLKGEMSSLRVEKLKNFNKLNRKDSAIVELEKIRSMDPGNLSTLHLLSNYYLQLNKPDEAHSVIENALQINSKNPKSRIILADIYLAQAKWDSAEKTLGVLIDDSTIGHKTKEEVANFIYSKYKNNPSNSAIQQTANNIFKKLIHIAPKSGKAYALAADFFLNTDQTQYALRALARATELNPTNDSAWQKRLQLLLKQRRFDEVIEAGKQAIQKIPQDPILLYILGNAYLSSQQYHSAEQHLKEASALPARRPLKANIFGSLADTYAGQNNWSLAFKNYQEAIDLDTQNPVIYNNYAYYLSQQGKQLSKAEELALRALEFSPNNTSFLDTVGWIYYKQGQLQKAQKYIQQAIDSGDPSAETLEHMGDILLKLDKPDEAKKWWQKALNKDSTRTHLKEKISDET